MATQPTNLPVPSESPRDLKFNAGKIDEFVTSPDHYYADRFGAQHWTIAGITNTASEAISQVGYITLDSFEDGATITLPNQALRFEVTGEYYRWDGNFPNGGKVVAPGSTPTSAGGVGIGAWLAVGDATVRKWASENFQSLHFKKSPGSFTTGGSAIYNQSALLNVADGMYYMPKTGAITAPAGSSPDNSWICVGLMSQYELGDLRNFKGVGDGVVDDTAALTKALDFSNTLKKRTFVPYGFTFISDKQQVSDHRGYTITGGGCIKMIGGRTGAFYYADGAQITFINSRDIIIDNVEFDGNRAGSPLYTGFNHGVQFVTSTGDFRSNNGGDTKQNRNIRINRCRFHDQGGFNAGIDKFGDGVYLFGCDGVVIENNSFKDIGRWGVASSDSFNVHVINNRHDCSKSGTVALGFCDIENESTDQTNGSYSRDIVISGNTLFGFGQILVGGGNGSENNLGAKHYLRNVVVSNNTLTLAANTHSTPAYLTNLIMMGCAPFCNVAPANASQAIDNTNIVFEGNTVHCAVAGNLAIGFGINAQGIGISGGGIFNPVNGVTFNSNNVYGCNKGIQCIGVMGSSGHTLSGVSATNNTIDCTGSAGSIGIRFAALQLVAYNVSGNIVRNCVTRGIDIEDGRVIPVGVIDTYGHVANNQVYSTVGTAFFANAYRAAFFGNTSLGGALVFDATVMVMDKDYGNTWNHILRTINGFTVNSMSQITQDAIDIGSQTRYGYTVQLVPPFNLEGAQSSAMVTGPGLARAFITNLSSSTVTKASDVWHLTVEKK